MDPKEFGEYLKSLREEKGLTLTELSNLSTVSHPYLSQIENGRKSIPSIKTINKLAEPLGVDQFELAMRAGYYTEDEYKERKWLQGADEQNEIRWEAYHWLIPDMDNAIKDYCRLILDDKRDTFSIFAENDFWETLDRLALKFDIVINEKVNLTGEDYLDKTADLIINTNHIKFKLELLKELQRIAHESGLLFDPLYKPNLNNVLNQETIYYKGIALSEKDKERIRAYLEVKYNIQGDE